MFMLFSSVSLISFDIKVISKYHTRDDLSRCSEKISTRETCGISGTEGLSSALTLTDSLPCCDLVLSSTTSFLSTSGKKRGKETPQGTNGSLTSLRGRRALGRVRFCHANWPLHLSGAKCGIDFPLTTSVAPVDSRALFAPANRGAFAHRCPSRFQRIFAAPKAGDFLEFTSFDLPQAALR
ncbi:MAG: hypothetical protein IJA51_06985 [Oscillospiraceae bacterium]|nr:hypothetical protein [Oscillospiraceae bacterium]